MKISSLPYRLFLFAVLLLIPAFSLTATESLPLKPIMAAMGAEIHGILDGILLGDDERVSQGARAIAHHPEIAPAEIARIRRILGPRMKRFEAFDKETHRAALALAEASRTRDNQQVIDAFAAMQKGCLTCHSRFRAILSQSP